MDRQEVVLLVMLDLGAAFDTVDISLLLGILSDDFGIGGLALDWFKSYLSSRKQRVIVGGAESENFNLRCGVPQGSCLGPILFLFYVSRLFCLLSRHLPDSHGFSDDSQLYLSFRPLPSSNQLDTVAAVSNCLAEVRAW